MKRLILDQKRGDIIHLVDHTNEISRLKGDAMITTEQNLAIGVYGADCSIIVFWDNEKIGACHAGWQGYVLGLVKRMAEQFQGGNCYVAPFMHSFEIKKDFCYEKIAAYSGEKFLDFGEIITFDFRSAIVNELSGVNIILDHRNTFTDETLGSNRRGYLPEQENTQNRVYVWRYNNQVYHKFFKPSEVSKDFFENWIKATQFN